MPSVFAPVTNPRSERLARLPAGLSLWSVVRKKLIRASLTAVAPSVLVLLITNSWAREGVTVGKPGTVAKAPVDVLTLALSTVVSSRWKYQDQFPVSWLLKSTRSPILSSLTIFLPLLFE